MSTLRTALIGNGVFSTVTGAVTFVYAAGLADFMSISDSVLRVIGAGTVAFGLLILWEVRTPIVGRGFAQLVVAADVLWVAGAVVVVLIPGTMDSKWLLGVVSSLVAVFAAVQARAVAVTSPPRRLTTEIAIDVPPERVWAMLTDFDSYRDWNPFMVEASGAAERGAQLTIRMQQPGGSVMTFTPTVTHATEPLLLEWLGSLVVPGLFDGRHRFELEPTVTGTKVTHSEEFTGLLVPLLWRSLDTKTRSAFDAMNRALKSETEGTLQDSV